MKKIIIILIYLVAVISAYAYVDATEYDGTKSTDVVTEAPLKKTVIATSIKDFYSKSKESQGEVIVDFPLTVTYVNQQYCYVIDGEGTPDLIYGWTPYTALDVIPAGWKGKYMYDDVSYIIPVGTMPDSYYKGNFTPNYYNNPDPHVMGGSRSMVHEIVIIKDVYFRDKTPATDSEFFYNGNLMKVVKFCNKFQIESVESGTYDVIGAVSRQDHDDIIYPIEYIPKSSGIKPTISDIENDIIYYNLQGIKVDNPGPGIYLRKINDTLKKIIIK